MGGLAGNAESERLVVPAFEDIDFGRGAKVEIIEELQESCVLFIDTENDSGIAGVELREENAAVFADLRNAAAKGDAVRAGLVTGEAL